VGIPDFRSKGSLADTVISIDICFSSRHYPHITIKKGTELTLEDEIGHKEDIQLYIAAKLRLKNTKAAQTLQAEILEKSSLIFLWVVLVVDILNSEYPGKQLDLVVRRLPIKVAVKSMMAGSKGESEAKRGVHGPSPVDHLPPS